MILEKHIKKIKNKNLLQSPSKNGLDRGFKDSTTQTEVSK